MAFFMAVLYFLYIHVFNVIYYLSTFYFESLVDSNKYLLFITSTTPTAT